MFNTEVFIERAFHYFEFIEAQNMKMLVTQSSLTLCDWMDCSPPGFYVHGILQTRILEWVAISLSRDLPNPGIKPRSSALQADALPS